MSKAIRYKKRRRYKYTLAEDYAQRVDIRVEHPGSYGFLSITTSGLLSIKAGYAWDGASGPTLDTPSFMRGSLVHDALYQLMRAGVIPQDQRLRADKALRKICREDGMSRVRAWWVYRAVRKFGAKAARADVLTAP